LPVSLTVQGKNAVMTAAEESAVFVTTVIPVAKIYALKADFVLLRIGQMKCRAARECGVLTVIVLFRYQIFRIINRVTYILGLHLSLNLYTKRGDSPPLFRFVGKKRGLPPLFFLRL